MAVVAYPGGKGGAGVYQRLINLMPPHRVYIEPFLGGGSVMRWKRPAQRSIGVDMDAAALAGFGDEVPGLNLVQSCGIEFLRSYPWAGDELVYADPPYPMDTRTSGPLYAYEMTDAQHVELLEVLRGLPCRVMVSSYWSPMYAEALGAWEAESFQAMSRGGLRTEWVWRNYARPVELHDYSFLGEGFRERERIKRKRDRWSARLLSMPVLERQALLAALAEVEMSCD